MKIVVVLAVLAAVAVVIVFTLGGASFGVDAANPLGVFAKIDARAKELGLTPGPNPEQGVLDRVLKDVAKREGVILQTYLDRVPGFPHFLLVAREKSGRVIAIVGKFRSQMFEYTSSSTVRSGKISAELWMEAIGAEPSFKQALFGTGAGQELLECEAAKGAVTGKWVKNWGGGIQIAHQVTDLVQLFAR